MTKAVTSGLSRRALFGLGGTTLLAATAVTAWRWRPSRAVAAQAPRSDVEVVKRDPRTAAIEK